MCVARSHQNFLPEGVKQQKTITLKTDFVAKRLDNYGGVMETGRHNKKSGTLIKILVCLVIVAVICAAYYIVRGLPAGFLGLDQFSASDSREARQIHVTAGYSKFAYPPMHYTDANGELTGFDIELAGAAGEIMNAEIEFIPVDWSERAELLESGEVDMLWGGLERASLDEQKVKFTKSYLRSNIVLLMNEDRDYAKFEDLQGLNVCALNFTPAFYYLQAYNRDVIQSKRSFTPPDYRELMNTLSSGEFDCMITDASFASFFLKTAGAGYKVSDVVMGSNYAVALRVNDTELFDSLQGALDQLESDGVIADLQSKWIGNL